MLAFTPLPPSTQAQTVIYRLILQTAPGRVDTGASYPGCASNNTGPCQAIQFGSLQAAIDYAKSHGEVPVAVSSADEAWRIIAGSQPIAPQQILSSGPNWMLLLAVGAVAFFIGPKLLKRFA